MYCLRCWRCVRRVRSRASCCAICCCSACTCCRLASAAAASCACWCARRCVSSQIRCKGRDGKGLTKSCASMWMHVQASACVQWRAVSQPVSLTAGPDKAAHGPRLSVIGAVCPKLPCTCAASAPTHHCAVRCVPDVLLQVMDVLQLLHAGAVRALREKEKCRGWAMVAAVVGW